MSDTPAKARPSILEATRIQARAVIPIVKAFEREIGKERAHAIVGEAIAGNYVAWREKLGFEEDVHPREEDASGPAFPVTKTVVVDEPDRYGHDITGCAFADYFRSIGEPEIGALMCCGVDFAAEARMRPGWEFTRTRTQMQGAAVCDFRWRRREAKS